MDDQPLRPAIPGPLSSTPDPPDPGATDPSAAIAPDVAARLRVRDDARSACWRAPRGVEVELAFVPSTPDFRLGSEDPEAPEAERPAHARPLPRAYWIARDPITWAQYEAFCADQNRRPPERPHWAGADHPVVSVTWCDAEAYCAWAGLALPTEVEWELAARGAGVGAYPWGDAPPRAETCVWVGHPTYGGRSTAPVGACSAGAAGSGARHMAGNVWEWCHYAGAYRDYGGDPLSALHTWLFPSSGHTTVPQGGYALRGGSFRELARACRVTARRLAPPHSTIDCGFRPVLRTAAREAER